MSEWLFYSAAVVRAEMMFPGTSIAGAMNDAISSGMIRRRRIEGLDFVPVLNPGQSYPGVVLSDGTNPYDRPPEISRADFEAWLASLAPNGRESLETAKSKPDRSYGKIDAPLLSKMREMILSGEAASPSAAALHFVEEAVGGGSLESKQRRLQRGYEKTYGVT